MERREYNKPTMKVVQMKHRQRLLEGSGVGATRSSYGTANTEDGTQQTWGE